MCNVKIAIGTTNKAKVNAIKEVCCHYYHKEAIFSCEEVPSGVSPQPFSDQETMQGAMNRAVNAREQGKADIGIGLEGGVLEAPQGIFLCNWGALTDGQITVVASGARILLPEEFELPLMNGVELGKLMDEYTKRENIREHEGAIGIFTNGYVDRKEMFIHVTKLLLGQYEYKKGK